ncbi:MAG: YcaO-like family protein [Geminicoccaceae bacterium]
MIRCPARSGRSSPAMTGRSSRWGCHRRSQPSFRSCQPFRCRPRRNARLLPRRCRCSMAGWRRRKCYRLRDRDRLGPVAPRRGDRRGARAMPASSSRGGTDGHGSGDRTIRHHPRPLADERMMSLSTGMAAHGDIEQARLRGLLELVERDAAAHWWIGGRPARRPPGKVRDGLADWRERHVPASSGMTLRLLDITRHAAAPVMVAVSAERDGRGLAFGIACRTDPRSAALAALREMCQMRFALATARLRKNAGAMMSAAERNALSRAVLSIDESRLRTDGEASGATVLHANASSLARTIGIQACSLEQPFSSLPLHVIKLFSGELRAFPHNNNFPLQRLNARQSGTKDAIYMPKQEFVPLY